LKTWLFTKINVGPRMKNNPHQMIPDTLSMS
jgi:hypothetical protein